MKISKVLLLAGIYTLSVFVVSAQTIVGTIIDANTHKPVAFVNVGVVGKTNGTVSTEYGKFALNLTNNGGSDVVLFSMLGYEDVSIKANELKQVTTDNYIVKLKERAFDLKATEIKPCKSKEKVLGNTTETRSIIASFNSDRLGCELGTIIKIKRAPSVIEDFNFCIAQNKLDTLFFRVNIYAVKDGLPSEKILKENVYVKTTLKYGVVKVDLRKYDVVAYDDFIISLEWLKDYGTTIKDRIYFSATFLGSSCYFRDASQNKWEKAPATIGVGFNATVKYCK